MITNEQAIKFAISIGWDINKESFLMKKSHKMDAIYRIKIDGNKSAVKTICVTAQKFNPDKYAVALWDEKCGLVPIELCLEVAEMFASDLDILARWITRKESMIKEMF